MLYEIARRKYTELLTLHSHLCLSLDWILAWNVAGSAFKLVRGLSSWPLDVADPECRRPPSSDAGPVW